MILVWAAAIADDFVDELVARGMHEHAYVELLRRASACDEHALQWRMAAGQVLWDARDWEAAGRHFGSMEGDDAQLAEAWSWYQEGQELRAASLASQSTRPEASYLQGLAQLRLGDTVAAAQAFDATTGALAAQGDTLAAAIQGWRIPYRSPALAGGLSAVLPGAGQAYVGRWGEAASAVLVNGLLVASAVQLYKRELWFAAGAVTFLELGFYGGGIASAANGARRFNRVAYEERSEPLAVGQGLVLTVDGEELEATTARP